MTQTNLTLLHKTRETALKNGTAERFGGEDLPLIDTTRMGDPLGVMVPARGERASRPSAGDQNRYVLTLSTRDMPNGGSAGDAPGAGAVRRADEADQATLTDCAGTYPYRRDRTEPRGLGNRSIRGPHDR